LTSSPPRELWTLLAGVVLIQAVGTGLVMFTDLGNAKPIIAIMIGSFAVYVVAMFWWAFTQ
jgi:hypothetical protein